MNQNKEKKAKGNDRHRDYDGNRERWNDHKRDPEEKQRRAKKESRNRDAGLMERLARTQ